MRPVACTLTYPTATYRYGRQCTWHVLTPALPAPRLRWLQHAPRQEPGGPRGQRQVPAAGGGIPGPGQCRAEVRTLAPSRLPAGAGPALPLLARASSHLLLASCFGVSSCVLASAPAGGKLQAPCPAVRCPRQEPEQWALWSHLAQKWARLSKALDSSVQEAVRRARRRGPGRELCRRRRVLHRPVWLRPLRAPGAGLPAPALRRSPGVKMRLASAQQNERLLGLPHRKHLCPPVVARMKPSGLRAALLPAVAACLSAQLPDVAGRRGCSAGSVPHCSAPPCWGAGGRADAGGSGAARRRLSACPAEARPGAVPSGPPREEGRHSLPQPELCFFVCELYRSASRKAGWQRLAAAKML